MDQEYVVDSSGRGTHETLATALQDAVAAGGDATILVEPTIYGVTAYGGEIRHLCGARLSDRRYALCGARLSSWIELDAAGDQRNDWPLCLKCEPRQRSLDERRKAKSAG